MTVDDGTVTLTTADLASLNKDENGGNSGDETLVDDSESCPREVPVKTERIVRRNDARNQAVQISAPLDKDLWRHIDRLVIEDNSVDSQGIQVNYAISREMMMMIFDQQNKVIAASRQKPGVSRNKA